MLSVQSVQVNARALRENIGRAMVGKEATNELLLVALLSRGHVLLEDVPGLGKTTLAKALARSLGCTFQRLQFAPDLLPPDITGVNVFNQKTGDFEFRPGPIMAQIVLTDEINRAGPRTQSALLEAMEERQGTVDGVTRPLPRPFLVIATQNPIELEGPFPLPEAQLDRFLLRLSLGYPSGDEERTLLRRPSPAPAGGPAYLTLSGPRDDPRLIVRRCCQAMLEWALTFSRPRLAGQTPRAYGATLAGALPVGQEAIAILSHTYVLARFAAEAPSLEQARHAERAWDHRRALRPPATPHHTSGLRRPLA